MPPLPSTSDTLPIEQPNDPGASIRDQDSFIIEETPERRSTPRLRLIVRTPSPTTSVKQESFTKTASPVFEQFLSSQINLGDSPVAELVSESDHLDTLPNTNQFTGDSAKSVSRNSQSNSLSPNPKDPLKSNSPTTFEKSSQKNNGDNASQSPVDRRSTHSPQDDQWSILQDKIGETIEEPATQRSFDPKPISPSPRATTSEEVQSPGASTVTLGTPPPMPASPTPTTTFPTDEMNDSQPPQSSSSAPIAKEPLGQNTYHTKTRTRTPQRKIAIQPIASHPSQNTLGTFGGTLDGFRKEANTSGMEAHSSTSRSFDKHAVESNPNGLGVFYASNGRSTTEEFGPNRSSLEKRKAPSDSYYLHSSEATDRRHREDPIRLPDDLSALPSFMPQPQLNGYQLRPSPRENHLGAQPNLHSFYREAPTHVHVNTHPSMPDRWSAPRRADHYDPHDPINFRHAYPIKLIKNKRPRWGDSDAFGPPFQRKVIRHESTVVFGKSPENQNYDRLSCDTREEYGPQYSPRESVQTSLRSHSEDYQEAYKSDTEQPETYEPIDVQYLDEEMDEMDNNYNSSESQDHNAQDPIRTLETNHSDHNLDDEEEEEEEDNDDNDDVDEEEEEEEDNGEAGVDDDDEEDDEEHSHFDRRSVEFYLDSVNNSVTRSVSVESHQKKSMTRESSMISEQDSRSLRSMSARDIPFESSREKSPSEESANDQDEETSSENELDGKSTSIKEVKGWLKQWKFNDPEVCCVCFEDECDDTNPFVYCDGPDCEVIVHRECYGLSKCPGKMDDWFCDRCEAVKENPKTIVACALCPDIRGAFRKLERPLFGVEWTHIACAVWVPAVNIGNTQNISNITLNRVPLSVWKGRCCVCEEPMYAQYGASVKCSATSCDSRFHVTCGFRYMLCRKTYRRTRIVRCFDHDQRVKIRPLPREERLDEWNKWVDRRDNYFGMKMGYDVRGSLREFWLKLVEQANTDIIDPLNPLGAKEAFMIFRHELTGEPLGPIRWPITSAFINKGLEEIVDLGEPSESKDKKFSRERKMPKEPRVPKPKAPKSSTVPATHSRRGRPRKSRPFSDPRSSETVPSSPSSTKSDAPFEDFEDMSLPGKADSSKAPFTLDIDNEKSNPTPSLPDAGSKPAADSEDREEGEIDEEEEDKKGEKEEGEYDERDENDENDEQDENDEHGENDEDENDEDDDDDDKDGENRKDDDHTHSETEPGEIPGSASELAPEEDPEEEDVYMLEDSDDENIKRNELIAALINDDSDNNSGDNKSNGNVNESSAGSSKAASERSSSSMSLSPKPAPSKAKSISENVKSTAQLWASRLRL